MDIIEKEVSYFDEIKSKEELMRVISEAIGSDYKNISKLRLEAGIIYVDRCRIIQINK